MEAPSVALVASVLADAMDEGLDLYPMLVSRQSNARLQRFSTFQGVRVKLIATVLSPWRPHRWHWTLRTDTTGRPANARRRNDARPSRFKDHKLAACKTLASMQERREAAGSSINCKKTRPRGSLLHNSTTWNDSRSAAAYQPPQRIGAASALSKQACERQQWRSSRGAYRC